MSPTVRQRARLSLPFAAIAALAVTLVPLPGPPLEPGDWIGGGLLVVVVWLAIVFAPWERIPPRWQLVPLAGSLVSVALLRDATGGAPGGMGVLVLLPVVWVALYGDRLQLHVVGLGTALVWAYPLVVVGAPKYPATGWRTAALFVALSWVIGVSVQDLVLRRRAAASALRERDRERERLLARLAALAATDELTGLANRRAWDDTLRELTAGDAPFALALFDLSGWGGNDVVVEASTPKLIGIDASGSGDIAADGVDAGALDVRSDGSADIVLEGAARRLELELDGSGDADLSRVTAREARVSVGGSGDADVRADGRLDVAVDGSGDVRYHGHPQLTQRVDGSGDVSRGD
jgi:hypothetical protein